MAKRVLISVSNKEGITSFARGLVELGFEIISTGGTAKILRDNHIDVTEVTQVTGFPECLDGRVKTLHPKIHMGLLADRDDEEHMKQLNELDVAPIDMVVVNLYPFKKVVHTPGVSHGTIVENIDIGGPTMIRAAAKNYRNVAVVVEPGDYEKVLLELRERGELSLWTKQELCAKAFRHTAHYDALIAEYFSQLVEEDFPELLTLTYEKVQELRYGENPHQKGAFYKEVGYKTGTIAQAQQLHGKRLSFNNINDANAAIELLKEFDAEIPTVVALKHTNPCGVGVGETVFEAWSKAYEADPVSIFGGIIATNHEIDELTARAISKIFVEIVIAPSYTPEALEILMKKKNLRLLKLDSDYGNSIGSKWDVKKINGGILIQEVDKPMRIDELRVVTERTPDSKTLQDLLFAWRVVKHVKSNGIVVAKNGQTLGIGPGQVNRIWAVQNAIRQSRFNIEGAVLASDGFFPFADSVETAAKSGIKAIIQPGGSIRDQESIDAANRAGIVMVFTGIRHFKH